MKKLTSVFLLFVALLCVIGKSHATQLLGGEIYYSSVAPGTYIAYFKGYYDCRGTTPPSSIQFSLVSPGCGGVRTFTSNSRSIVKTINPYCASTGNSCNTNAAINVVVAQYNTLITVPAQCPEWILSVRECSKAPVANLINSGSSCLYLEAQITTGVVGNHNVSPEFISQPNLFVTVNSSATISNLSEVGPPIEIDSIAYSLKTAQDSVNKPYSYSANTSFLNPIPSANGVHLNPATGLLTFTPNVYISNGGPGSNIYTVVVEATGYKKINGVMTKASTAQRSIPVFVVNNAPNVNPEIINVTANGQAVQPNSIISVQGGSTFTFQFSTADANAGDSVTIISPMGNFLTITSGTRPTGTFTWQFGPADLVIYFPVTVKDNACPVPGITTHVYGIKVLANPTGLKKDLNLNANFTAYPNPFSEEVSFRFEANEKAQSILIYNLLGQQVDQIDLAKVGLGEQDLVWGNARKFGSGTYIAKLVSADKTVQTLKFTKL